MEKYRKKGGEMKHEITKKEKASKNAKAFVGEKALAGAVERIINSSRSKNRDNRFEQWDNYNDHNQFPDHWWG